MARLSLRPLRLRPGRTVASVPNPPPLVQYNPYSFRFPTSARPSYASVLRRGLPTQHQEESCPESEFELDSSPRLTFITNILEDREPKTPTSPPWVSPPSSDGESAELPTFGSNNLEWHSSDAEDDTYFKTIVDKFINAAVCHYSKDNIDTKPGNQQQTDKCVESALKYYNNDKINKVKYDLIRGVTSCGMVDVDSCYGHVNFIAKGDQENSEEELFFAEIQLSTDMPTCVLSLEGVNKVGGLRESKYDGSESNDDKFNGKGIPIDAQHCYACRSGVMHPKNGALYRSGHVAFSGFYHG
ncbi:unnamed protein product [Urochloa decumbens]|uniref:DUF3615 domain-containing protein n=1 Tax=Urochloa decumbens TaxID=240449 RepID=A0ABC8VFW5_9POAL